MDSGSRKRTTRQAFEDNHETQVGIPLSLRRNGAVTMFSNRSAVRIAHLRHAVKIFNNFSKTYTCTSQAWRVPMPLRPTFRRANQEQTP